MPCNFFSFLKAILLVPLFASPVLLAQSVQVKIIGLDSAYTSHDITTIALDLGEMLKATPGRSGSSASTKVLSGRSLIEAYYHPEKRDPTRTALDIKSDFVVILPEFDFLNRIPEATFDGVLQMSRRALSAGSTPLLLMPRGGTSSVAIMGENSYRIGNGCGIAVVPGGYAVNSQSGLSSPSTTRDSRRQAYLLAATLYRHITGLNSATATTYVPTDDVGSPLDVSNLAGKAVTAVTTHATTNHYTTSRHLSGAVSYRTINPPADNFVRYAFTGTSTENGISDKLDEIIQASGHITKPHIRPTSDGQVWNQTVFDRVKPVFDADPNEYLFLYARDTQVFAQNMVAYNQANLMPIFIDRHYDGVQSGDLSTRILLRDLHERTDHVAQYFGYWGWKGVPLHLGHARLNDVDSAIYYSGDGTHMTSPNYYMMAAAMFTATLGRDPAPPAGLTSQQMKGFNVGKQMTKELAFLSETMAFTPESSIGIVRPAPLEKGRWESFSQTFTASGGTLPYTWTASSSLPPGLSLSSAGVLSGAVTTVPQAWNLVIKVTDATGAIHKVPFALNITTGVGSLAVSQTTSYTAVVAHGGPTPVATATYTVQNPGLTSINWTASNSQPWLSISPASGTLAAGASANVTVSMNAGVNTLPIGTHTGIISFTNTTSGFGNTTRNVSLRVNSPPSISTGLSRTLKLNAGTPWTPALLNPVGWYDASDAATVIQSAGLVSEWRSKSSTSHMLQATASKQPLIGTTQINGLNTIKFDGDVDAFKTAANPFGTTIRDAMVMAVANINTLSGTMFSLSGSSAEANRWQADAADSSGNVVFDCGASSGGNRLSFASGWSANQNKLLGFYSSEKAKVQQVWESGILRASDATGNTAAVNSGMALGNNGAHTDDNCAMGEVIILNAVVADASRQALEGYLAHKWGFTATLPSNHPYKTAPIGSGMILDLIGVITADSDNDPLTHLWTVVNAPSGFTMRNVDTLSPSLFFSAPGTYTLRLTTSDGYSQTKGDVVITVVENFPPVANAGADQTISLPASWTPANINPLAWYDATDATTITHSGGSVSKWSSKAGTGHMLQGTSAKRPVTGSAMINGLNAIAFDGTDDALKTASNPFGASISNAMLIGVFNIGTITNSTLFSLSGSSTNRWQSHAPWSDGTLYFDCGGSSGSNRVSVASGFSANQNKLLGYYCSTTDSVQQVWVGGANLVSDASGHSVATAGGIALGHDGGTTYDNCRMGEVLIINGTVSATNREKLEGYLAKKWGMTADLPANHPYKTAPLDVTQTLLNGTGSDPNGDSLTYAWSVVSAPNGFVIGNPNSMSITPVFSIPGTYTLRLTVSDGSLQTSDDVTITVLPEGGVLPSAFETWTQGVFTQAFTLTGAMDDADADGLVNLMEFAFGTDPTRPNATLSYLAGGAIISPGTPLLSGPNGQLATYSAIFARRKTHAADGITYSVHFSADLKTWTPSAVGLSVLTAPNSEGDLEVVSVPFPANVSLDAGGTALPTFFRVSISND